jgi:hypothetical protein
MQTEQNVAAQLGKMMDGLNMPLSVSSKSGAIRTMDERIEQIRRGEVQSMGSCNPPWSSWGN